jgi:hypothetical protein
LLEIISIGSSSGSDILFGILEGIKVISKNWHLLYLEANLKEIMKGDFK